MTGTKLYRLLGAFSKKEMGEFELFLASPFFTQGRNFPAGKLRELFALIKKYHPGFNSPSLSPEKIFRALYLDRPFEESALRNLFSKLGILANEYLSISHYRKKEFEAGHNLLIELFSRKLDKEFLSLIDHNLRALENREKNLGYYYDKFRTLDYLAYFKGRTTLNHFSEIQSVYGHFNSYYLLQVLQIILLMVNIDSLINFKFEIPMYKEVTEHIKSNFERYKDIPEILIYYTLIRLFAEDETEHYMSLKNLKNEFESRLAPIDRNNLYICMGNFCLKRISKGEKLFHAERFENDKNYLASGLLDDKHFIHLNLFLSMAMNAIDLGEFEWTMNLIAGSITRVSPEYADFARFYLYAEISYRQKNYAEALRNLLLINIEFAYYKQLIRNLKLMIYFDMGYFDESLSIAETSAKFLNADREIKKTVNEELGLFIRTASRLIKTSILFRDNNLKFMEEKELLKIEVNALPVFKNKQWILSRL